MEAGADCSALDSPGLLQSALFLLGIVRTKMRVPLSAASRFLDSRLYDQEGLFAPSSVRPLFCRDADSDVEQRRGFNPHFQALVP